MRFLNPAPLNPRGCGAWLLCGLALPAAAQPVQALAGGATNPAASSFPSGAASPVAAGQLFDFDMPAQPLESALQRYGNLTRQPALFRSEIVRGLLSAPVHGRLPAETALRLLLEGTGLVADRFDMGGGSAFTLKPASASAPAAESNEAGPASLAGYPAMLQGRVWQALCGSPQTAPGSYRLLLKFHLDATGRVQRAQLIGSSGDPRRDAAVLKALRQLNIGSAPPPGMPQPVAMLLLPQGTGIAARCAGAGGTPEQGAGRHG